MKKKQFKNLLFTALLLALFAVFLGGGMIWEHSIHRDLVPDETGGARTTAPAPSEPVTQPQESAAATQPTEPGYEARQLNFLLVGRDAHGEGENGRSDAMMLCSVDTEANTVRLISFLRDIYIPIPGHRDNRLNAAYSWGGSELLIETLEQAFGIRVDVTLEIDFAGFVGLIDRLDGVDITLTGEEANHLGDGLTEGVNHLNGEQALAYSRIRYLDSDFGRTERQRKVLTALLNKFRSASLLQMLDVTDAFLDESTSDHTDDELLAIAMELYPTLSAAELTTHRIPADGTYSYETIRGMSVIEVDFEANRKLLGEWME